MNIYSPLYTHILKEPHALAPMTKMYEYEKYQRHYGENLSMVVDIKSKN